MKQSVCVFKVAAALLASAFLTTCTYKSDSGPVDTIARAHVSEDETLSVSDEDFPATGLRSIFRSDFIFVTQEGDVNRVSVPPARPGCGVKLLSRGADRLKWRMEMLGKSTESVRVQTYIFSGDELGKLIASKLKALRAAGHDVRLTIDTYNKFGPADRLLYNELELAGIKIMGFEPLYLLGTAENKLMNVSDINQRFHEKYFVVDGRVAFVGGTNIANEYYRHGDDPHDMWRDQDLMLTGPVVTDVARAFDDNYMYFKDRRENRLPTNRPMWFGKAWWEVTGKEPPPVKKKTGPGTVTVNEALLDAAGAPVRFIRHRPRYNEDYIFQAYLHLIDSAEKSIIIENAYFVPNRALLTALMRAAKRGVKITIITNSDETNDVKGMQSLSRYIYLPLLKHGIRVFEWQGEKEGYGCLHSKVAVFDGVVSIVGSCNLDPRSFTINSENVVIIDSAALAKRLAAHIDAEVIAHSAGVTMEQAEKWREPGQINDKFKLKFGMAMKSWF